MIIRVLSVISFVWAGSASADTAQLAFQGLTFGEPIPLTVTVQTSTSINPEEAKDELPPALQNLCTHTLLPDGSGQISVLTKGCDGPVVYVENSQFARSFFDPATEAEPLAPGVAGFIFEKTTLAKVRTLFCSEGIVDSTVYGQADASAFGGFKLAYEIENTETIAVFTFQLPLDTRFHTFAPGEVAQLGHRDTAVLISVTLMSSEILAVMVNDVPRAGPNYLPLPVTLTDPSFLGLNCPVA